MSLATVYTRASIGMDAPLVRVEVHLSGGLPALHLVGLPETTVKESRERVRSALINSQFDFPNQRITINLAPADLPKDGGRYDLAIAIGILAASGQIPKQHLEKIEFIGELSLTGDLQRISGVLSACIASQSVSRYLIFPRHNLSEARLTEHTQLLAAQHLLHVTQWLTQTQQELEAAAALCIEHTPVVAQKNSTEQPDLKDVKGQFQARRALEIAAAGQHNLLFIGPPGTGKTLLARRLPGILPMMSHSESIETAIVYSISEPNDRWLQNWGLRPFRSPHHSASGVALAGGGGMPKPGEISLAHNGILFLDELPEFSRKVLDVLREPLETREINISRAMKSLTYPANFQLIAAMNPCPCGYVGDSSNRCRCSSEQVRRYQGQVSGPLMDRIDLHVDVVNQSVRTIQLSPDGESSATVQQRVTTARHRQISRQGICNAALSQRQRQQFCNLNSADEQWFMDTIETLNMSARSFHKLIQIARTIADLAEEDTIKREHLLESLSYRRLDKQAIAAAM